MLLEPDMSVWSPPSPPKNAWGRGQAEPTPGSGAGDSELCTLSNAPRTGACGRPGLDDLIEEDLSPIEMAESPKFVAGFEEPSVFSPTKMDVSGISDRKSPTSRPPATAVIEPIFPGSVAPPAPPPLSPKVVTFGALKAVR
jgi:hypothetical protein